LQDEWATAGVGGGSTVVVDQQTGGIFRHTTGGALNDSRTISWNNIRSLLVTKRVSMEVRVKLNQATFLRADIALRFDFNNQVRFTFSEGAGGAINWSINARDGGADTTQDSGEVVDTLYHIFRIECFPTGEVHFYMDGTEVNNSPLTTNIPDDATDYLQPYLYVVANEVAVKSMDVDYVFIRQER